MTVSSIVPVNTYAGNSSNTKFDYDFLIESENEIIVQHTSDTDVISNLTYGVDYSISEIGNKNGGYITFPLETSSYKVLGENEKISLILTLQIKQESEFHNSSFFNLEVLEWTFDYIVRILQILNRKIERCAKVDEGLGISPDTIMESLNSNLDKVTFMYNEVSDKTEIVTQNTEISIEKAQDILEKSEEIEEKYIEYSTSLLNLKSDGLTSLSNASNALRQTQITNCLLEIPQNIKLELSNGVLTLKSGSKVIRPNGVNLFEEITFSNDIILNFGGAKGDKFIVYRQSSKILAGVLISNCYSGDSAPSGNTYQIWYNTAENKIYTDWNRTGDWVDTDGVSLPLCIYTSDGTTITALKQVFNGIGYIGSHLFVNKGVKGLIPNGFNSDGTLKNIEFTAPNVIVGSRDMSSSKNVPVWYRDNNTLAFSSGVYYDEETNTIAGTTGKYVQIATIDTVNNKLENLRVKKPFRAMDYNEVNEIKENINNLQQQIEITSNVYVVETYANENSWYRLYSDGWCEQGGKHLGFNTITFLKAYSSEPSVIAQVITDENCVSASISNITTTSFYIADATHGGNHEDRQNLYNYWVAKGYIS